jgi:proline dehydrogenase
MDGSTSNTRQKVSDPQCKKDKIGMLAATRSLTKRIVYGLGTFYPISPKNLSEGLDVCHTLHACEVRSTLGHFNNAGDDPKRIAQECQIASDTLKSTSFYLSLKPPAFNFDIEPIAAIAITAFRNGHGINFDAHDHGLAEPTIQLLEQVMTQRTLPNDMTKSWRFSLTLPSRWKRSLSDAEWVIRNGVRARLVKGEFRGPTPSEETDPAQGFLSLVDRLAGNVPEIGVATHDYALAKEALSRCKAAGCPVELELLFGMPIGNMLALSQEMDVSVRFYVPYGDYLLIYGIRHFLTNPHKLLRPGLPEVFSGHKTKLSRITRLA